MTDDVNLATDVSGAPEAIEQVAQEKMIPVSRVEELVKKAKLKGRDAMQEEIEAVRRENEQLKAGGGSMGGMAAPIDVDSLRQQILADLKQQFQQQDETRAQEELQREAQRLADEYHGRMSAGKSQFEDFDEIMADFNPAAFPNLVYLATQVDNTPAVMYELMKNPSKWATAAVLAERDPNAAQNMINRMSASIKANETAKAQEREVNAPLSRMQSSPTGQDNGALGLRDFKRMFRG
jgi:FtsZ-binding cell division protein ZapB